ncbi:MAG: hypothetical protein IJP47_05890 [Prevotella sp.]|nr:hypothetical protein [Prevotella sp.]
MSKNTLYIKPNIQVVTLSLMPIMAGSAIQVSENGEADAKANGSFVYEEEDICEEPY